MSKDPRYSGGCHCGAVRFDVMTEPADSAICHCRTCQKTSGAESVGWAVFDVSDVKWHGEHRTKYASSEGVERSFCNRCGCSLSYQLGEKLIDIVLACLDDPEVLRPAKEIWLKHRLSWNALNPTLPAYPEFSDAKSKCE